MIATGTDVKPLEMRDVHAHRSRAATYFEQMKGRGVRVIDDTDLQAVTPDADAKDRFVIVDAVGVTETELIETHPLDRKPTVPLEKLLHQSHSATATPTSSRRSPRASPGSTGSSTTADRDEARRARRRLDLKAIARALVEALDPDRQLAAAAGVDRDDEPDVDADRSGRRRRCSTQPSQPLAANPELRERARRACAAATSR